MLLFTQPANEIIQFAPPEWLWHKETVNFPSHAALKDDIHPNISLQRTRSDVAGLVGLRSQ